MECHHKDNICEEEKNVVKKKVSQKDVEIWEVAGLSCVIAPVSKASDVLRNFEEKRRCNHENAIKDLAENLQKINIQTENDIKMSSVELKAHIKHFEEKLKEMKRKIDKPQAASYSTSVFQDIKTKAKELKSHQQALVEDLRVDLIKFENKRGKEVEKLFQFYCEKIRKIGYFLPYKLQCYVEEQALKMNRIFLNNRRCYDDLNFRLVLLTEQMYKSFLNQVECIQEKWINYSQQQKLDTKTQKKKKSAKLNFEFYERHELKGCELTFEISPNEMYSICKIEEWSKNIMNVIKKIESFGRDVLELFKKLLNAILQSFDCENEEIKKVLQNINILPIEERLIRPIMFEHQFELTKDVLNLESMWQDSLLEVKCILKDIVDFLRNVGNLWERHLERLCESKKLILMALEKITENTEPIHQDLEAKLNIALDTLSQEHNKIKLEKEYESVIGILNKMKEKYESTYINEVETVEDFYKMMDIEADVLSSELKEFIYMGHITTGTKNIFYFYDSCSSLSEGIFICKEIRKFGHQIRALKIWKHGIWSALENLALNTRKRLENRAESWIKNKIDILAERMSIKLELLQNRYERIRVEIYERRLEEVICHEEIYNYHREEIDAAFRKTEKNLEVLVEHESDKLNNLNKTLEHFEDELKKESRWAAIKSLQIKFDRQKTENKEKRRLAFETFKCNLEIVASDLKEANIRFMKTIKLFHENGNYSAEEGLMYVTNLENVDKEINSKKEEVEQSAIKNEDNLEQIYSASFAPITSLLNSLQEESLFFHTVEERINKIKETLEKLAKEFKFDFDALSSLVDCIYQIVANREKPLSKIGKTSWDKLFIFLYKNVSNLFYPLTLIEDFVVENEKKEEEKEEKEEKGEGEGERDEKLSVTSTKTSDKIAISEKPTMLLHKKIKKNFSCTDYAKELLKIEQENGENDKTFMGVVRNLIWKEMNQLQKIACIFYKNVKGNEINRKDVIQETYDLWANNILQLFRLFDHQCEHFWLKTVLEFLPLLGRIKSMTNHYLQRKLNEYEEGTLSTLKNFENEFRAYLENESSQTNSIYEDLDNKLLPLHGYVSNQCLLDALQEEVVRKTSRLGIDWDDAIKKFKNQLACFALHHVQQRKVIKEIETECEILKTKIFNENLEDNLLNKVLQYIYKSGHNVTASKNSLTKGSEIISDKYRLNFYQNLQSFQTDFEQLNISIKKESCDLDPKNIEKSLSKSENSLESMMRDPCWRVSPSKVGLLSKPLNLNEQSNQICKTIEKRLWEMQNFADAKVNVFKDNLFKWLNLWKINVKKVQELYTVEEEENSKIIERAQFVPEINKPTAEKTSDSVTSPRLCPTSDTYPKDTDCNTLEVKNRSLKSRPISHEQKNRFGLAEFERINLPKSKLTEFRNSNTFRFKDNVSLTTISPRNYHGLIPIPYRYSFNLLGMSATETRNSSPLKKTSPKELKFSSRIKTITLDHSKKKTIKRGSRSPSPLKKIQGSYKRPSSTKPSVSSPVTLRSPEKTTIIKRGELSKQNKSPRINSPTKRKAKINSFSNVEVLTKEKIKKENQRPKSELDATILKQTSQPSLCKKENIIQAKEKISLDHLKNEVFAGDHKRLSFEKVHTCIKKSVENLSVAGSKRFLGQYSSEDLHKEGISLSFLQNIFSEKITSITERPDEKCKSKESEDFNHAIITVSGHELNLTPSIKLEIEKEEMKSHDIEISKLLQESGESFEDSKDIQLLQDDANEYDSEVSTDGEPSKPQNESYELLKKNSYSLWKSREAALLNDVDYRQSVYHPAVSRRQNNGNMDFRPKSKSIENTFGFSSQAKERVVRSRSSNLRNKYSSHNYNTVDDNSIDRSWDLTYDQTDGNSLYSSSLQDIQTFESIRGLERTRTRKERISGAILRSTLKVIRLLALFNLWPGDFCHMLTVQTLRLAR